MEVHKAGERPAINSLLNVFNALFIIGGGIHFTVNATRKATLDELTESLIDRLEAMLECGESPDHHHLVQRCLQAISLRKLFRVPLHPP